MGTGVALITETRLRWHEPGSHVLPAETTYLGVPVPVVLPPGERARMRFTFAATASSRIDSISDLGTFAVEVDYGDGSGQLQETTRFDVVMTGEGAWRVRQVHFFEAGQGEPYASSGVGAERR